MKKIIMFFCLVLVFFTSLTVNADVIVNEESKQFLDASIVNDEVLKEGYFYKEKLKTISNFENVIFERAYYLENIYVVIGCANDGGYISYPYIGYYENSQLKWEKIIKSYGEGKFITAIFKEDQIACFGNCVKEKNLPIAYSFDYLGSPLESMAYASNGYTTVTAVYPVGSGYVIVGTTTATDGVFGLHKTSNVVIFMLFVDKIFSKRDLVLIGNDGNAIIYDVCKLDKKIYIYSYLNGEGYFDVGEGNYDFCMLCFDEKGEFINYFKMDFYKGCTGLVAYNSSMYFYVKEYEKTTIDFYKVSPHMMQYEMRYYSVPYLDRNIDLQVSSFDNNICFFEVILYENEKFFYVTLYKDGMKQRQYKEKLNTKFELIKGVIEDNNIIYCSQKEISEINNIVYIQLKEGTCSFNDEIIEGVLMSDDVSEYGYYDSFMKYSWHNIELYIKGRYLVPPEINIIDKGIYDVNLKIEANGKYRVNNVLIEEEFIITEEGIYLVELLGNDVVSYYTIEIKKISTDFEENVRHAVEINYIQKEYDYDIQGIQIQNMTEYNQESVMNIGVIIMIIIMSCGFVIGLILPIKIKKGNEIDA